MKTTLVLLTTLMIIHTAVGTCAKGTLVCDASGSSPKSAICDFVNGYVSKTDGSCESKTVEGCAMNYFSDEQKPCLTCNAGLVLDSKKEKCVAVEDAKKKENCKTYDKTTSVCTACNDKFFVQSGECKAVTTAVDNCGTYDSATTCQVCADGYYLKDKACVKIEVVANCQFHTDRQCDACSADYFLNRGYNATITLDNNLYLKIANDLAHGEGWTVSSNTHSVCEKSTVENCATQATAGTCTTCNTLYFLNDSKVCELNPEDPIDNCKTYSNAETCTKCNDEFYLADSKTCTAVKKVTNCKTYTTNADSCSECLATHYLSGGACTERSEATKSINKCKTLNTQADECSACEDNYTLTTDKKACFADINKCKNGQQVVGANAAANNHTCTQCDDGYYVKDSKECLARTVQNCKKVAGLDTDTCEDCNDNYNRVSATSCVLNTTPVGCTTWAKNTTTCTACDPKSHTISGSNCVAKNIPNCVTYTSSTSAAECEVCANQKKPATNKLTCVDDALTGCATTDGKGDCVTCNANHTMANNKKSCFDWTQAGKVPGCQLANSDESKCDTCMPDYFKPNDTTCTIRTEAKSKTNCNEKTSDKDECTSCNIGRYLNNNLCDNNTAQNCKEKSITANKCEKCNDGYYSATTVGPRDCTINNNSKCKEKSTTDALCNSCNSNTHYQSRAGSTYDCMARTKTNCKADTGFSLLEDKCTICNQGEYLKDGACVAVTTIKNCKTYETASDVCNTCDDGYYKTANNKACNLFPDGIKNCAAYSNRKTCTYCDPKFYLSSNACPAVTTEVPNCMIYSNATTCQQCSPNYFHDKAANKCESQSSSSNCAVYASKDTCSSCKPNYVMDTTTKKCSASGISGCILANKSGSDTLCTTCEKGKLLSTDKKKCTTPSPAITNCADYSTAEKCKECKATYFLALDGKSCTAIGTKAGANCSVGKQTEKPICDVCKYGFEKDSTGACVALPDANCAIYNKTTKKCSFCFPGTWMDKDGKCNKETPPNKSVGVFKSVMIVAMLSLIGRFFQVL